MYGGYDAVWAVLLSGGDCVHQLSDGSMWMPGGDDAVWDYVLSGGDRVRQRVHGHLSRCGRSVPERGVAMRKQLLHQRPDVRERRVHHVFETVRGRMPVRDRIVRDLLHRQHDDVCDLTFWRRPVLLLGRNSDLRRHLLFQRIDVLRRHVLLERTDVPERHVCRFVLVSRARRR